MERPHKVCNSSQLAKARAIARPMRLDRVQYLVVSTYFLGYEGLAMQCDLDAKMSATWAQQQFRERRPSL